MFTMYTEYSDTQYQVKIARDLLKKKQPFPSTKMTPNNNYLASQFGISKFTTLERNIICIIVSFSSLQQFDNDK